MATSNNLNFEKQKCVGSKLPKMNDIRIDHPSYNTHWTIDIGHILPTLWGPFVFWTYSGGSCPNQHAVSIQVVSQIPQTNLGFHPYGGFFMPITHPLLDW